MITMLESVITMAGIGDHDAGTGDHDAGISDHDESDSVITMARNPQRTASKSLTIAFA
ncbi:MAG: hypothetical protein MJE77_18700 [Proteobacteria bacterium]|nr:hypothetical protein [Pseudomonadota bacterium]